MYNNKSDYHEKNCLLLTALCLSMSAWSQDGLVYWSQADGYKFDFDLDGTVDFSLPTQTTDKAISQVFVFDANGDGYFDLCELDLNDNLINWIFYYNDGNNNFVDPQTVIYGMSEGDKNWPEILMVTVSAMWVSVAIMSLAFGG